MFGLWLPIWPHISSTCHKHLHFPPVSTPSPSIYPTHSFFSFLQSPWIVVILRSFYWGLTKVFVRLTTMSQARGTTALLTRSCTSSEWVQRSPGFVPWDIVTLSEELAAKSNSGHNNPRQYLSHTFIGAAVQREDVERLLRQTRHLLIWMSGCSKTFINMSWVQQEFVWPHGTNS